MGAWFRLPTDKEYKWIDEHYCFFCCYCCCCPWCCCCWKRWRLGVGFATDQEYKWIDEYWPFPDSLVLTHSLNCFSYHLYLFLYNEKLYSINYNWLGSNSEIWAQTCFIIFSWYFHGQLKALTQLPFFSPLSFPDSLKFFRMRNYNLQFNTIQEFKPKHWEVFWYCSPYFFFA